jgi:hypothetical protein
MIDFSNTVIVFISNYLGGIREKDCIEDHKEHCEYSINQLLFGGHSRERLCIEDHKLMIDFSFSSTFS